VKRIFRPLNPTGKPLNLADGIVGQVQGAAYTRGHYLPSLVLPPDKASTCRHRPDHGNPGHVQKLNRYPLNGKPEIIDPESIVPA
jgi:hypothetical protein